MISILPVYFENGYYYISPPADDTYYAQITDSSSPTPYTGNSNTVPLLQSGPTILIAVGNVTATPSNILSGQTTTLSVGITGGTTPYNVTWLDQNSNVVGTTTTSNTTATIILSPTASNNYSASVTDSSTPAITNTSSNAATVTVITLPPSNNNFTSDIISKYSGRT